MKQTLLPLLVCATVSCGVGVSSRLKDNNDAVGTFSYTYHNHQWNGYRISWGGTTVEVDTPEGDATDPARNMSFGFRPHLIYNRFSVMEAGQEARSHAVWKGDAGAPEWGSIYCQRVESLAPPTTASFPVPVSDLLAAFGLPADLSDATCGMSVNKPGDVPGGAPGAGTFLGDEICLFSPKMATGNGPRLVTIYAPRRYSEQPIGPFLNQWPAENIQVCIDGRPALVKDSNPPDVFPTPTPHGGEDFRTSLTSSDQAIALGRDVGRAKGVKFIFDRKDAVTYFQNTVKFDYHLPFINQHIVRFGGALTASQYEALLFAPMPKELSGGEMFWSPSAQIPGLGGLGALGFTVYYRDRLDVEEIRTAQEAIRSAAPFAADRILFVFENTPDFMRYRNLLQSAGVISRPLSVLTGR